MKFEKNFRKAYLSNEPETSFQIEKTLFSSLQSSLLGINVIQKILFKSSFTVPGNNLSGAIDFEVERLITITKMRIPQ